MANNVIGKEPEQERVQEMLYLGNKLAETK